MVKKKKKLKNDEKIYQRFELKEANLRVIKTSLKSIIKTNKSVNERINRPNKLPQIYRNRFNKISPLQNDIYDIVLKCNHIQNDAYHFIKLFILYKYNQDKNSLPEINKKFITYVIRIMGKKSLYTGKIENLELNKDLVDFYENEYKNIYDHQPNDLKYLKYPISYMTRDMEKNIKNNLKEHFIQRLKNYIKLKGISIYEENRKDENKDKSYFQRRKSSIYKLICCILDNKYDDIEEEYQEWFYEDKKNFIPKKFEKCLAYDCKSHPLKYLKYTIYIATQIENNNDLVREKMNELKEDIVQIKRKTNIKIQNLNEEMEILRKEIISLKTKITLNKKLIRCNKEKEFLNNIKLDNSKIQKQIKEKSEEREDLNDMVKKMRIFRKKSKERISPEIRKLNKQFVKTFNILPLSRGFVPKYISFDTLSLIQLLIKNNKSFLTDNMQENKYKIWNMFFNMGDKNLKDTKEYKFDYFISTDGIGCSILFRKNGCAKGYTKKIERIKPDIPYINSLPDFQFTELKDKKIVCCDPGKKFMAYMMDQDGNELKYSSNQRRAETKSKRCEKILIKNKNRNHEVKECENKMSLTSSKTVNFEKFKEYIKIRNEVEPVLSNFYEDLLLPKLRWRKYIYKQKSESRFVNNIQKTFGKEKDIIICLGDWSNMNKLKNGPPCFGDGLKKIISKNFKYTVLLDEFNTSKKCHGCSQDTENIQIDGKKIYRLLGCKNCNVYNKNISENQKDEINSECLNYKYINRDKNSCLNMIKIVQHMINNEGERLSEYSRFKDSELSFK